MITKVCGDSSTVEHTSPIVDGGSNPTSPLHFKEISEQTATGLVIEHHYLHHRCPITKAWGIEQDDKIVGVLTIGVPVTYSARCDVVGENKKQRLLRTARQHDVYELNRLWLRDDLPKNSESRFIGWCLRQIIKAHPHMILISYADGSHDHVGIVYQATNWMYIGESLKFDDIAVRGGSDYRSVAEKIRGGVVFRCEQHDYFEGPLPPKSKTGSKNLPPVPLTLRCPQCGADAPKTNSRAWCFIRLDDGVLKKRGRIKSWTHFTRDRVRYELELRPRPPKHRYVWFAAEEDKKILAKPALTYPKTTAKRRQSVPK